MALYVLEPDLWRQPSASVRHWQLVREALDSLAIELRGLGGELCVRIGSIEQILNELHLELGHFHLHAHEETGEAWTYARDKRVTQWCSQQGLQFSEYRNFGVFRSLKDRDGWARRWRTHMRAPITSITQQNWLTAASTADWQAWQPRVPGEP